MSCQKTSSQLSFLTLYKKQHQTGGGGRGIKGIGNKIDEGDKEGNERRGWQIGGEIIPAHGTIRNVSVFQERDEGAKGENRSKEREREKGVYVYNT